ncbi:hypothetical protein GKZ88_11045 [Flavobacterium sp. LC2016-01]|nr:hypothetical protein [Flavobacterium sp. LC2016-01]
MYSNTASIEVIDEAVFRYFFLTVIINPYTIAITIKAKSYWGIPKILICKD